MVNKTKKKWPSPLRVDLGSGAFPHEDFVTVDIRQYDGKVQYICDLGKDRWPFPDESVDESRCHHMLEHLDWPERIHFFQELWRVMKYGSRSQINTPHWCSSRHYGDPTHKSPISAHAYAHLNQEWRQKEAPHTEHIYKGIDFDPTEAFRLQPWLATRTPEFQQFAVANYKEVCEDLMVTLIKNKRSPKKEK